MKLIKLIPLTVLFTVLIFTNILVNTCRKSFFNQKKIYTYLNFDIDSHTYDEIFSNIEPCITITKNSNITIENLEYFRFYFNVKTRLKSKFFDCMITEMLKSKMLQNLHLNWIKKNNFYIVVMQQKRYTLLYYFVLFKNFLNVFTTIGREKELLTKNLLLYEGMFD